MSCDIKEFEKIENLFCDYKHLLTDDFKSRMKKCIRLTHFGYLHGACKEAKKLCEKTEVENLFTLIISLYNKKRDFHTAKFLLIQCFENALRSTLAIEIAKLYNKTLEDDWFNQNLATNSKQHKLINKINHIKQKQKITQINSTLEAFDLFTFGDLEDILKSHWSALSFLFTDEKTYKNQPLPVYGTKEHVITKISKIRLARNEIFHNKPSNIKFQKDLEAILLRFGFNLKDAINIGDIKKHIILQYVYD